MARYAMNIRPRYSREELDQERNGLTNGIGGALDEYLQLQGQRTEERNRFGDLGIEPEPNGPSPLRRAVGAVRGAFGRNRPAASEIPTLEEVTEDVPGQDWDGGQRPEQRPLTIPPAQMAADRSTVPTPRPIRPSGVRPPMPQMLPAIRSTAPAPAPPPSVSPKQNSPQNQPGIGNALGGALASGQPETFVYQGTGQKFRVPTKAARDQDAASRAFHSKIGEAELEDVYKGRDEARQAGYAQDLERLRPRPNAPAIDRLSPAGVAAEKDIATNAAKARAANPTPLRPRAPRVPTNADAKAGDERKVGLAYQFVNRAALADPSLKGDALMRAALKLAGADIGRNGLDTGHFAQATTQYSDRLTSRSPYGDLFGGADVGGANAKRPISQSQYDAARGAGKTDADIEAAWSIPAGIKRKR